MLRTSEASSVPLDWLPRFFLRAFRDGVAENQFVVAGFKGRKRPWRAQVIFSYVFVKILEELHECIRIAFCVPTGIDGVAARRWSHQRWIFEHQSICSIAPPDPHFVR